MTIIIKNMTKETYIDLTHKLDLFAGDNLHVITVREDITYPDGFDKILYSVTIRGANDFTIKLEGSGVYLTRAGVIPSYFLPDVEFDRIFIM